MAFKMPPPPGTEYQPQPAQRTRRQPGSLSPAEFRSQARSLMPQALDRIQDIIEDPKSSDTVILTAVSLLAERAFGKAVQPVEIGGPGTFEGMTDAELKEFVTIEARALITGVSDGHET